MGPHAWLNPEGQLNTEGQLQNLTSSCSHVSESYTPPRARTILVPGLTDPAKEDLCWTVRAISYQIFLLQLAPSHVGLGQTHPRLKFQSSSEYLLGPLNGGEGQSLGNETG